MTTPKRPLLLASLFILFILLNLFILGACAGEQPSARDVDAAGADGAPPVSAVDGGASADGAIDATAVADGAAADGGAADRGPTAPDGSSGPALDGPFLDGGVPGTVITDDPGAPRIWPAAHGEAMVSLWSGDALAAMAITIDDNTAPDHDWWSTQGKTYGMRFTWFIITNKIGTAWGGSWADFAKLVAEGHDVQSHTVSHLGDVAAGTMTIEEEYRDSQKAIEDNLPGVRALTLAYPGGTNSYLNDEAVAAKYYIGARGVVGHDNAAVGMNYMRTNSISGQFVLETDHWAGIPNLITLNPAQKKSFRNFHCIHYHQVGDKAAALTGLQYVDAHADEIWLGLFREVMQYGQERDAATLKVPHVSADRIVAELSDTLDDGLFDFPLTLKIGLASDWKGAAATQGGKPVPVKLVTHGGAPFALVQAVPDRGPIELTRQ